MVEKILKNFPQLFFKIFKNIKTMVSFFLQGGHLSEISDKAKSAWGDRDV